MDGDTFATGVFVVFNVLSITAAVYCGYRSYVRHRRPVRAVFAATAGLLLAPAVLMLAIFLTRPRGR